MCVAEMLATSASPPVLVRAALLLGLLGHWASEVFFDNVTACLIFSTFWECLLNLGEAIEQRIFLLCRSPKARFRLSRICMFLLFWRSTKDSAIWRAPRFASLT
mmetsp:Transcript_32777/g.75306  ORF Transcript_32777/g.75306 Transcript_32777/m.75306 type:complete len:104 (-) Transcript_32777:1339-1650(-)